ncbi:SDR family NAD(P)-dependent oxidoreductase [Dactylosporangium vinaceum]|uniref:SDR family oxidoreductase n=1 Tax=Dactylosporangium vinaceum TaxID=53362 RepID=A0ABV5MRR1_9ACTN|nr:SDR family oxidoreductase [Dactylosporangium vinaceum]UAC00380.1 SDR family NAD(P)-dependent oxidoreductase [Dactylosporangium vinaceum]
MRTVVITGAGQGLGRAHALAFGAAGYHVVLNDLGAERLDAVAAECATAGATVTAVPGDIADWDFAASVVQRAVAATGRLDALVNNAGMTRDRMVTNMTEAEWDDAIRVNLKGHFAPLRHASAYWKGLAKAGTPVAARIVNTTSGAGLMGNVGQVNYSAAKAAIAAVTVVAAAELERYGVTVNAIAPSARTPMTADVFADAMRAPDTGFDAMAPENVSPLVVWLASPEAGFVTGRVFEVSGGSVSIADGWQHGPATDAGRRWDPNELGPVVRDLLTRAPQPAAVYGA